MRSQSSSEKYLIGSVRLVPQDPQPSFNPRCTTSSSTVREDLHLALLFTKGEPSALDPDPFVSSSNSVTLESHQTQSRSQAGRHRRCPQATLQAGGNASGRKMSFMCHWGHPSLLERQRSSVCLGWPCVCVCVMTPLPFFSVSVWLIIVCSGKHAAMN